MKIDIRSDKSLYVEIDGYTVYIDTSLADGIHIDHWYGDDPVKVWIAHRKMHLADGMAKKNQPCATEVSQ